MRLLECLDVELVQHEHFGRQLELALDRDLRHLPAGGAEPALPHSSTVPPGSTSTISTPAGACSRNASGVPVSAGNVPQWHGTQRLAPSSSSARAASRGPIV